jgi:O-antigen/teichoic acid export membrane protein
MLVSILANIFTTRILLDALGASDYGLYNVVGGAIMMLGFLTSTMTHTTQRFLNYAEGEGDMNRIKEVFNNSLIVHYIVAIAFTLILLLAGLIFFNGVLNIPVGRESAALVIYACLIFSTAFSVTIVPYDSILNAHENMFVYSIIGIFDVAFKLAVALIVLFVDTDRLILYGILMALESWLVRYITKRYCKKTYPECDKEELRKYYRKDTIKEIASFAGWNLVNIASGMTSQYGKNVAVNHFFGTILNAALGIATQLSGVIMGVSANMIKAITPILVKSEAGNQRERMLDITYVGCRFSYLLFSFFCIPVLFFTDYILELWLGDVPLGTSIFCKLIIIAHLIEQLVSFLYQAIAAQGDIRSYNIARSIVNIMPLITTILLFINGYEAYWTIVCWIVWYSIGGGIVNLYYSRKNVGLSLKRYIKMVLFPCSYVTLITVSINFAIVWIASMNSMSCLIYIFVSIILSIPFYWFLGLNKGERSLVLKNVSKKI